MQGPWQMTINNRFGNQRKTKPVKRNSTEGASQKPEIIKKTKRRGIPELDDGETAETCKEHIKALQKELAKTTKTMPLLTN